MAEDAGNTIETGTTPDPPEGRKTAAILIRSPQLRQLVEIGLQRLGFSWLASDQLSHAQASFALDPGSPCELILVDEDAVASLRKDAADFLNVGVEGQVAPPVVVLLLDADAIGTDPGYPQLDGVLRLPLSSQELAIRLGDILHAHRAALDRCRPLLNELGLLRRVLQSVSSGVTIADAGRPDLPLVYVNSIFEKMTGYTLDEVRGQNCRFLQGPDAGQPGLDAVRNAIRDQGETLTVLKNYRKDGSLFWNELYFAPLRDGQGRVTHFAGIQNDVTQRVNAEQQLLFLAHHDSLTGLANRGLLFERLEQAIVRSSRQGTSVALLFFDLNNFKNVNDIFGHSAGDQLLRVVGDRLKFEVRECDTVARLGGDEFVALIPDLEDEQEIFRMVERITSRIGAEITVREETFHLSVSVGWSIYPRDGRDPDDLLKVADLAMYGDKHTRRQAKREHADWLAEQAREF